MKKIVWLGLIGVILTGCGGDEVTKEYLVGDWECASSEYQRNHSVANEDFGDPVSLSFGNITTFKIIDNELFQINKYRSILSLI